MELLNQSLKISASTESDFKKETISKEGRKLEIISTQQNNQFVNKRGRSILGLLENLWQNAIAILTKEPEMEIWQKQDRYGRIHWYVYDPQICKSISFLSELDMLSWLDNRNSHL
jgi:hypothetical protein